MKQGFFVALAIVALALPVRAADRDFTVTAWGGAVQDAKREVYFTPFAKAKGIKVLDDVYAGGWAPFKAMQDTGVIPWDVIQVETAEMVRGCEEGVFAPVDWSKMGFPKDHFLPTAIGECGVGHMTWSMVISFNADLTDTAPKTVQDFWDTKKWPGKRGMRVGPKTNLEIALMADGVAPEDVYDVLSTKEGINRAFAKLDEIKPEVQWWKSGAQAPEWLVAGDVVMSIAYNGRVASAIHEGQPLGIIWQNTMYDFDYLVTPAKSPYHDTAFEFMTFVSDNGRQAEYSNRFAYGPAVKGAAPMIKPEQIALMPAGDNLATALHIGSDVAREFWANHLEELTQRWDTWVSKS